MASSNKIVNFKLNKETIKQLMKEKIVKLDCKKNESPEIVLSESRIKLDIDKKSPTTAVYYNNKSTNLHFFGNTVSATANIRKVLPIENDKKRIKNSNEREKTARGIESLDIPSIPNSNNSPVMSPPPPTKNKVSSTTIKKSSSNSSSTSHTNTTTKTSSKNKNNIPPRTPQSNTPRPSSSIAPTEKLSDRVIQLLAFKPYQVSTLAKLLDCTQWDVKKIVDEVGFLLPDPSQKKKYCLKPTLYKKIRIWDWPVYTQDEKLTVLANTKEAYELLQIPLDSPERHNLMDPTQRAQQIERERTVTPVTKKPSSSSTKKPVEKKSSPDLKGKGKTTPSGFSYTTTPEPPAPTPSSKLSPPSKLSSPSSKLSPSAKLSPSSSKLSPSVGSKTKPNTTNSPSTTTTTTRPTSSSQTHLKPSSSNKKVGSKALPQVVVVVEANKRKPDYGVPSHPITTSSKRLKPNDTTTVSHDATIELSHIGSQPMFDKYCSKFISSQKEYIHTKSNFKSKFPQYIHVLESTKPPTTGSKRSYFDLKLEYYDLVKENYLKNGDESSWEEAESQLRDCNEKRRRLNFMWSSIEKNMNEHHYTFNKK